MIAGTGVGLRARHYPDFETGAEVPFIELLSDNYLWGKGPELWRMRAIAERLPSVMHGVALNLGGIDPIDVRYVRSLGQLQQQANAAWISDHLSFCALDGQAFHDLLPLPRTLEAVNHVAARIRQVQDMLQQRILIENASSYAEWQASTLTEAAFLSAVLEEADCDLLLDVNNVYVTAHNLGFDAEAFIRALPTHRIRQLHIAGFTETPHTLIDTHGEAVHDPVWELLELTFSVHGNQPLLVEWDKDVPDWETITAEVERADAVRRRTPHRVPETHGSSRTAS